MRSPARSSTLSRLSLGSLFVSTALFVSACTSSSTHGTGTTGSTPAATIGALPTPSLSSSSPTPTPTLTSTTSKATPRPTRSVSHTPTTTPSSSAVSVPPGTGPVIVIDPGHSVTVHGTDPATGLNVSDYENEPEMRDVYAVSLLVKAKLEAVGYRVVMTKNSLDEPTSLGKRAEIANDAHAALALSIHDQAGASGGIPFTTGNNIVYYQSVGDYRATPSGKKIYFTNAAEAATSKRYGEIFQSERSSVEGHSIRLQGNVGYDLGSRGLPAGNIWIVQLLSKVPWIYNEAGGNSAGLAGLSSADKTRYADGLVASVEKCVPVK